MLFATVVAYDVRENEVIIVHGAMVFPGPQTTVHLRGEAADFLRVMYGGVEPELEIIQVNRPGETTSYVVRFTPGARQLVELPPVADVRGPVGWFAPGGDA